LLSTSIGASTITRLRYEDALFGSEYSIVKLAMARGQKIKEKVDVDFTLRRVFGKQSFRYEVVAILSAEADPCRPLQREVIAAAIEGHDVFLQAATSFGKSLCFQLPAVVGCGSTRAEIPCLVCSILRPA
jgi:ATP-dependent helicase YprA (DUF1998 family)